MAESESILETIVSGLGLEIDEAAFNPEIIMYVNSALLTVYQNGAGTPLVVKDYAQTWEEFKDPAQVEGNKMFEQIKLYVMLKTKIIFDPPPPSTATYMQSYIDELLWRIRVAYCVATREEVVVDDE